MSKGIWGEQQSFAKKFGVDSSVICEIIKNKIWKETEVIHV